MTTVFIYALKDPRNGAVRYIGKAENPASRLKDHIESRRGTHKAHWISQLRDLQLFPTLEILDAVPKLRWQFFERAYIRVYREAGANLTNSTDGGEGLSNPPPETRAKIAAAQRAARTGRKQSPETVAKRAASLTGLKRTPEQNRRMSELKKAQHAAGRSKTTGQKRTPEQRARMGRPRKEKL